MSEDLSIDTKDVIVNDVEIVNDEVIMSFGEYEVKMPKKEYEKI